MRSWFSAKPRGNARLLVQQPIFQSTEVSALLLEMGSINTKWLLACVLSSERLPTMCRDLISAGVLCHLLTSAAAFAYGL